MQLADAYPDLDSDLFHVLVASEAIDEDQPSLEGVAAQILYCQQRGWHTEEGSALIQCVECMFDKSQ